MEDELDRPPRAQQAPAAAPQAPSTDQGQDRPPEAQGGLDLQGKPVVVLSFFDGIGTIHEVLRQLDIQPAGAYSWEVNEQCLAVLRARHPHLYHRGDINQTKANILGKEIRRWHDNKHLILIAAGPPCPDYSRIRPDAAGREGEQGQLFDVFARLVSSLEQELPDYHICMLVENVVMNSQADVDHFSRQLSAAPVLCDAAEWGLINRPRLWWSRIDWSRTTSDGFGRKLVWSKSGKTWRLHLQVSRDRAADLPTGGMALHEEIVSGKRRLPCLTTPAPDDAGRAAPKSMIEEQDKRRGPSSLARRWQKIRTMALRGHRDAPLRRRQVSRLARGCEAGASPIPPGICRR